MPTLWLIPIALVAYVARFVFNRARRSRDDFEAMNRAIVAQELRPVIDKAFSLEQAAEAFALMECGGHFGKIGVSLA